MQTASHSRRLQLGWPPFRKADRSNADDSSQADSAEIEQVDLTSRHDPDVPRDAKWSKWLDYLPKAPRIALPRTDAPGSEIAVLERVESPPQDGRDPTPKPIEQSMSSRSLLR